MNDIRKKIEAFAPEMLVDAASDRLSEQALIAKWSAKMGELYAAQMKESDKHSFNDLYEDFLTNLKTETNDYILSGFRDLDEFIGGFLKGELVVIGARPGMGKTSLLISFMDNFRVANIPCAYFTLEQSSRNILTYMMSKVSLAPTYDLLSKNMTDEKISELKERTKSFKYSPITLIDNIRSIEEISLRIEYLVKQKEVKVVMIDYIQLISCDRRGTYTREAEVSKVCSALKRLAQQLQIVIIANSQLSRAVETRGTNVLCLPTCASLVLWSKMPIN